MNVPKKIQVGSSQHCYQEFCEKLPELVPTFPDYAKWMFSKDPRPVAFRQGWAAAWRVHVETEQKKLNGTSGELGRGALLTERDAPLCSDI